METVTPTLEIRFHMYFENKNVSIGYDIAAYIYYLKRVIVKILNYRKAYHNYFEILIHVLGRKLPVKVILKKSNNNKKQLTLHSLQELNVIAQLHSHHDYEIEYNIEDDMMIISSQLLCKDDNRKVILYGAINNGDTISIFLHNEFHRLPVRGMTIVDIGANIGDSLVYFALRGADNVIGLEPFPRSYEMAVRNIQLNNLSNKVLILLAGCSARAGSIVIDPLHKSSTVSYLREFRQGITVPLMTLEDILNENNTPNGKTILKMDCEGCEYETILSATVDTLSRFSHIQIEYHYGYKNLKEKLEECGFKVSVTIPKFNPRHIINSPQNPKMRVGWLYAVSNFK
jgi:FkbM family methyltransferase